MIEPSASIRQAAHQLREMFVALRQEGFDGEQAIYLVSAMAHAMVQPEDGR